MEEIMHHLRRKKNIKKNTVNNAINYQLVQDFFHQQYVLQILLKKHLNYEPPACDKKRHEGSLEGSWWFGHISKYTTFYR